MHLTVPGGGTSPVVGAGGLTSGAEEIRDLGSKYRMLKISSQAHYTRAGIGNSLVIEVVMELKVQPLDVFVRRDDLTSSAKDGAR